MEHTASRTPVKRARLLLSPIFAAVILALSLPTLTAAVLPQPPQSQATSAKETHVSAASTSTQQSAGRELDVITHIETLVQGELTVWKDFRVHLRWQAPADARAGDTFSVKFPEEVNGITTAIDLNSEEHDASVGSCALTDTTLLCTFNEIVEQYDDVHGWVDYTARPFAQTQEDALNWHTGFRTFTTEPGIAEYGPVLPHDSWKSAWISDEGIRWELVLTEEHLQHASGSLTLTDDYDDALTLIEDSFSLDYVDEAAWQSRWVWRPLPAEEYDVTTDDGSFALTLDSPVTDGSTVYRIQYTTVLPEDVNTGDVFTNTVGLPGRDLGHTFEYVFGDGVWLIGTAPDPAGQADTDAAEQPSSNSNPVSVTEVSLARSSGPEENLAAPAVVPSDSAPPGPWALTGPGTKILALVAALLLLLAAILIAESRRRRAART